MYKEMINGKGQNSESKSKTGQKNSVKDSNRQRVTHRQKDIERKMAKQKMRIRIKFD